MSTDVLAMVRDELTRRLDDRESGLDAVCAYALEPSGKLLRPVLVVESALAVGGSAEAVLPAAIGVECGHVASLIHDDIVDNDELRRGRLSVPRRYGVATALLAGDMLLLSMFDHLIRCRGTGVPDHRILDAATVLIGACRDLCGGEHLELDLVGAARLDVADYLAVVRGKTAAAFRGACVLGGILGGGSPELVEALGEYGTNMGIAFQIQDDLLPYTSDASTSGKPVTSDVANRRLTLPLIMAYKTASPAVWARLDRALSGAVPAERVHADVASLLIETNAIERARDLAAEYARLADKNALLLPDSEIRDRLRSYVELAVNRDS